MRPRLCAPAHISAGADRSGSAWTDMCGPGRPCPSSRPSDLRSMIGPHHEAAASSSRSRTPRPRMAIDCVQPPASEPQSWRGVDDARRRCPAAVGRAGRRAGRDRSAGQKAGRTRRTAGVSTAIISALFQRTRWRIGRAAAMTYHRRSPTHEDRRSEVAEELSRTRASIDARCRCGPTRLIERMSTTETAARPRRGRRDADPTRP
jgi:hypothetical protein